MIHLQSGGSRKIKQDLIALGQDLAALGLVAAKVAVQGSVSLGDVGNEVNVTVNIGDVGTSAYVVLGNLESLGDPLVDNNVFFTIRNQSPVSFQVLVENIGSGQPTDVRFNYMVIKV